MYSPTYCGCICFGYKQSAHVINGIVVVEEVVEGTVPQCTKGKLSDTLVDCGLVGNIP